MFQFAVRIEQSILNTNNLDISIQVLKSNQLLVKKKILINKVVPHEPIYCIVMWSVVE